MFKRSIIVAGGLLLAANGYTEIIFSEYIEGSSNNKALEIQNKGSATEDLSNYTIELYSNGNITVQNSVTLSGTLEPEAVYVIANASAVADILDVADITSTVTYFNGNDVLLLKQNGTIIDRIGQLGNADYYGANVTLVRNPDITSGDAAYDTAFDPSAQWQAYDQNTFAYLGNGETDDSGTVDLPEFVCADPATLISSIQSNNSASPQEGELVDIEAIVIADLQNSDQMKGFFVQEEDADTDGDATTSEGLFIYHSSDDVAVGDKVRIRGYVDEYYSLTQINNVQALTICGTSQTLPSIASVSLPVNSLDEFEAVEGMRIALNSTLTVNEVYNLGRYGEFLVSNGRRFIPTEIAIPGDAADAIADQNALNVLIVEDGTSTQNPETMIFPAPQLDAYNTLRVGNTVSNLVGVVNFAYGAYKLIPTETVQFNNDNPRTDAPEYIADSDLRIASFNVLNYFNGDGLGGGFPTDRGADTAYELERQEAKLVAAITAIDADILGLMELENDGYEDTSAIASLVAALNANLSSQDQYDYIVPQTEFIGTDAIAVGLIYRPTSIALVNSAKILDSTNSPLDDDGLPLFIDDLNRPALAQSFEHLHSHERFTIVVNHLKSKGNSNCADYADCDVGQGAYNIARTNAALALTQWLESDPTGVNDDDVLIMGDLNAYSKEDPITTILANGYALLQPEGGYSYVYSGETGTLDHSIATESFKAKAINVQDWHINTDEPSVLDYNTEYKSDAQILSFYAPTPFRSSDHDPVVLDFAFNQAPIAKIKSYKFFRWLIFASDSYDLDGYITGYTWQIGDWTSHQPWLFVKKRDLKKHHISSITLTVEDNDGALTSTTANLKDLERHNNNKH